MAYLFEVQGKSAVPNTETLLVEPFKSIWKRDKDKQKSNALEELTYIEFMSSQKKTNPFRQYPDYRKSDEIIKQVITQKNWKPDKLVLEGIKKIDDFQKEASSTYSFYLSAKKTIEALKDFFDNVDLGERNDKGMPVYKPAEITRALNDVEKVTATFKNLEKKMSDELIESTKTKGGKEISPFAMKSSLDKR